VQTVQGYATHEREVFETVARVRTSAQAATGSPAEQALAENAFVGGLRSLLAVVENYPDLKASGNFLKLQEELANTEDRIQAARRFFNANVRDYNTRLEVIPSNIVAGMFSFKPEEFFEIESACERAAPVAKF
jgi:LemA protein